MVVGAPGDVPGSGSYGRAYVFNAATKQLLATLDNPAPDDGDIFGYAVAVSGNTVVIGAAFGPPLPVGWNLIDVADFNGDGFPDYLLFQSSTGLTLIGYMSGPTVIGAAFGPTIPITWPLVATADLDGDGNPDYVLYNPTSGQTAIAYLANNILVNAALGPIIPAGWSPVVAP